MKRVALHRPASARLSTSAYRPTTRISPTKSAVVGMGPPPPSYGGGGGGPTNLRGPGSKNQSASLAEVMKLVEALPVDGQRQVLDQLALRQQTTEAAKPRDLDMWSQAVYDALQDALGASAGALGGPLIVKRTVGTQSAWKPVDEFLRHSKLGALPVRERLSVYGMLARLLVKHAQFVARKSGAPLSPKLVGSCTGNIAGVFEQAFPGYLFAGLAPIVARRLAEGVHG